MLHSAEKRKRGPFFINTHSVAKYQKTQKRDIKNFEKKSHSAKQNWKGDPLVPSGHVGNV